MKKQIITSLVFALLFLFSCGESEPGNSTSKSTAQKESSGLTEFEQNHGIGPVTEVITIGEIEKEKAEKGETLFKTKCSACHKVGERYIGPDLKNVLSKRSPSYVMNMILNPDEMVKKHPEAKKLLAEFLSPMPNQNLEMEEARAIVEYLASVQNENASSE